MPCSFSGHTNPSRGRFCLECGRSLALRCPRCQADLPATAKFCPECGTPAAHTDGTPEPRPPTPPAPGPDLGLAGERRQLTMVISQADMCDPGWNESMLVTARRSVSCTRSSARSTLPLSEIANARKLGTAASMASRAAGEASSARSLVVRVVESLVVAPGRDSDAAII